MSDLRSIPRVAERRLLGSLLAFRNDRLGLLRRAMETDARLARLRLGPIDVVLVNDPDLAHEVLVERAGDFVKLEVSGMPASHRLLGEGVLQSEGEDHRARRKRLMPAFVPARVARYASIMGEETARRIAAWRRDGDEIALDEEMDRLTLAIFGRALFGIDLAGVARELGDAIMTAITTVVAESVRFVHLPLWDPTAEHRRFTRALRRLESTIDALVAARRGDADERDDLLSALVREAGSGAMSDAAVREELVNLVVAGFEATSTSLAWTLHLLARDAERGAQVADECRAVRERTPTIDDLARLPRSLAAFKEGMRLYPAAHIVVRQTARAVDLAGHAIGEGVAVFVNGYAIHRREDRWRDGESFLPERFDREPDRRAWFPFGQGPRTCIGNHFATLEGHVVVATIASRWRLAAASDADPRTSTAFAIRPASTLRARVTRS